MAIEIVDLPMKHGDFPQLCKQCKRFTRGYLKRLEKNGPTSVVLTGVFTFDPSQATCDFANDGHMGTEMGVKFGDFWGHRCNQPRNEDVDPQKWQRFTAIHPIFNTK